IISRMLLSPGDKSLGSLVKKNLWTFARQIGDDTFSEAMLMQDLSGFTVGHKLFCRVFCII
ncbi:hypothetical protein, partial [Serratia silvae]|uniref:hypothetical protein n=1 Tax=Serratia silvae TaxID=2824122 RepID=UPI0039F1314E